MRRDAECTGLVLRVCCAALLWAVSACSSPTCEDNKDEIASCGREYTDDVCATAAGRCAAACFARATCRELDAVDANEFPPWLDWCLFRCEDSFACPDGDVVDARWVCDGEEDCVGGADERGCDYFECDDGTYVAADRECDEWPHCDDRSDEKKCGYFLCGDNRMTVANGDRCNGTRDCDDGSDEEECP